MKIFNSKEIKKLIALTAGLLFLGVCFAQEQTDVEQNVTTQEAVSEAEENVTVLTVEDAVAYGMEHSPTLKSADIDLALAKWKKNTAWNTFLPSVSVTGSLARSNQFSSQLKAAKISETESYHWTAVGNLSASFNFNVAMIENMKATIASYESGKLTWEDTVKTQELSIRKLFYSLLLQQESLDLQKDSLKNARQRMNQAQVNYRNGYIPQIKYLQTQVAYENQVPALEKAENILNQSLDTFAFLIGMPVGEKIKLEGKIDPKYVEVKLEDIIEDGLENNRSLKALKQTVSSLKMQATALDLSTYTPSLALSWNGQPMITNAFDTDWGNSKNWNDNSGALSVSVVWNLTNMLPWSSTRSQAKEIRANISKLELNVETLERNTALEVKTAIDTLNQCRRSIETSERNIALAQKAYDMTWLAYRNGTTEYLDLVDSETQLNQAKLSLVSEKYNYLCSLMDLENIVNKTLTGENTK